MYTRKVEIQMIVDNLLKINPPQEGRFIGAFDLCSIYQQWKRDTLDALIEMHAEYPFPEAMQKLTDKFFKDFEENVRGEIIKEDMLFTDEEDENGRFETIDEKFNMESVYPKSLLKNTLVDIPEGFTHFMILPVDYNRGGDPDIGIAFLTRKGKKNYSQYLTGDY